MLQEIALSCPTKSREYRELRDEIFREHNALLRTSDDVFKRLLRREARDGNIKRKKDADTALQQAIAQVVIFEQRKADCTEGVPIQLDSFRFSDDDVVKIMARYRDRDCFRTPLQSELPPLVAPEALAEEYCDLIDEKCSQMASHHGSDVLQWWVPPWLTNRDSIGCMAVAPD